jgi:DNA-binding NarL/FixJ family response regulator
MLRTREQDDYDTSVTVRVLIVDPQPFFCESLVVALDGDPDIEVVGWATDELQADRLTSQRSPDVVLTEVELAGGSGLSLARRIADRSRTIILTRGHEGDVLLEAVEAGAVGCLSHDLELEGLTSHLGRVAEGRFAMDPDRLFGSLKRASALHAKRGSGPPRLALLTPREREVVALLARGFDNHAIARRLHLSTHTARTHVGNILRKLEVHSRADAARIALRETQSEGDTDVLRIRGPDLRPR